MQFRHENFVVFVKREKAHLMAFLLSLILMFSLGKMLGWKSFFLDFLILANFFIFLSYKRNISIPVISRTLEKEYLKLKAKENGLSWLNHVRTRAIYYLILLFHDMQKGLDLLIGEERPLGINFNKRAINPQHKKKIKLVREQYLKDYFELHQRKKKRATVASMAGSAGVFAIVFAVLILPFIFSVRAATYGWSQTDWSGGASTTATALHPDNRNGWDKYYSKDALINASSSVALNTTTTVIIDTLTADFASSTFTNAYATSNAITMLLPNNAVCSSSDQCANNSCYGTCFTCGGTTDLVQYQGGPYDSNGLTTTTGGYYRTFSSVTSTQCWFKDNLNVGTMIGSRLADNTTLQNQVSSSPQVIEKYCYGYTQEGSTTLAAIGTSNCNIYGGMYQYPETVQYSGTVTLSGGTVAAGNVQGICPSGWHIPSVADFTAFTNYLGGTSVAGGKMKETGNTHWTSNSGATNSSNFTAFAAGYRDQLDGSFIQLLTNAYFRLSDGSSRYLINSGTSVTSYTQVARGNSVRCIKDATSTPVATPYNSYATSTSVVKDLGTVGKVSLALSWNASTTNANGIITTVAMQVRSGTTATPTGDSGDANWTSWTSVSSGEALSAQIKSNRYFQYRAILSSNDLNTIPTLNDVSITYTNYPTEPTSLYSSKYDSGSDANLIPEIGWMATGTSANVTVKVQVRAASSSAALDSATWCGYNDAGSSCTGNNYFESDHNNILVASNHPLMSGSGHRWFQYRVVLTSDGSGNPVFDNINVVYLVNARPEFTVPATASQRTGDGLVMINYSAIDPDTASTGVACPNCVVPSFEYSIDNGANWSPITSGLPATSTVSTTISTSTPTAYSVAWNAKAQLNGIYATGTKIRITINDREGGANTAVTTTDAFALDVKDPVIVGSGVRVIASTTPDATLELGANDDTLDSFQMCASLDSDSSNCSSYIAYNTTSSFHIANPSAQIYVHFLDKFGNISTSNAVTPDMPTGMVIRDISDVSSSSPAYQELIVWKVVTVSLPNTFLKYHIWRSVNGGDYLEVATISSQAANYYFDQNLEEGKTYAYKVAVEDSNGNVSKFSSIVSDSTDGLGGTNTTPPTITNVEVIATTTQTATIEWDTNELANSIVHYSLDNKGYDQTEVVVSMVDSASGLGRHHVVLHDLLPNNRTYYFSVESVNAMGISGVNDNVSAGYSFTTKVGPVISGVTANAVSNNGATIIWNTTEDSDTHIFYSTSSSHLDTYLLSGMADALVHEAVTHDSNTSHSQALTGLSLGTSYYYYVKSGIATDNNAGDYYNFTTAVDTVSPVITLATSTIVTDAQALISWDTNELADSSVEYGTVSGVYTGTASDANLATKHNVILSGLTTSTKYYYHVLSADASGNLSSSTESSFTTLEKLSEESVVITRETLARLQGAASVTSTCPVCNVCSGGGGSGPSIDRTKPTISAISTAGTANGVIINWVTDKKSSSFVEYGTTSAYTKTIGQIDSTTNHKVTLDNLISNASYHYRVNSIDENGNIGQSTDNILDASLMSKSEEANILSSADRDGMFMAAVSNALSLVSKMSSQVSIGTLETALNSQYNLVRQLSDYVPAPMLGGEPKVTVTSDSATITWSSDKNSNSLVAIVPESKYDKTKGDNAYLQVIGNPDELTNMHLVTINNLEPETIYHFQVRSMSGIGSASKSGDFTFKTRSKELEISNYTVEKVSDQKVTFRWLSNVETDSAVKYTPYHKGVLAVEESVSLKNKSVTTLHEVTIDGFEPGLVYQIELSGKDLTGKIISKKIPDFSTGQDNLPPTIYQVQTESALSQGKDSNVQTIISWLTNEPAIGAVYYKKGTEQGDASWEKTAVDTSYTKKHIVVITKFDPGSIYQFKIESSDSGGNIATSKIYTLLAPKQKESVFTVIMNNFEDIFGWTKQIGQ